MSKNKKNKKVQYAKVMTSNINYDNFCISNESLYMIFNHDTIKEHLDKYDIKVNIKVNTTQDVKTQDVKTQDVKTFYMKVIDGYEMKVNQSMMEEIIKLRDIIDINAIGLGKVSTTNDLTYIVIISDFLQKFRKSLNLPRTDFNIVPELIKTDTHNIFKSLDTIHSYDEKILVDLINSIHKSLQKNSASLIKSIEYLNLLSWMMEKTEKSDPILGASLEKLLLEMIDFVDFKSNYHTGISYYLAKKNYLVGIYFSSKHSQILSSVTDSYDKFVKIIRENNTSLKFRENKDDMVINNTLRTLNFPVMYNYKWLYQMNYERHRTYNYYSFDEKSKKFKIIESPRNFSFVSDTLVGSSIPKNVNHIRFFHSVGIHTVITLMENPLPDYLISEMKELGINYRFFEVIDRKPPSLDQMIEIIEIIKGDESKKILIHCKGGVGRTATVLAAYLIAKGKSRDECMIILKKRKTILSTTQEEFLKIWKSETLSGRIKCLCDENEELSENKGSSENKGEDDENKDKKDLMREKKKIQSKIKLPGVIMTVGLPASGKSTFSKTVHDQIVNIERLNQDEIRTKGVCEDLFSKYTKQRGKTVILDRSNPTKSERKYWLSLNLSSNKDVWCIYFATPFEECQWRIKNRHDHPTVIPQHGKKIITNVAKILEPPTVEEGFSKIEIISSFKEANQLLLKIGCDISHLKEVNHDQIIKFPRTKHIKNLGSASRDDLLMTDTDLHKFLNVPIIVQEKVDGANMGLSIKDYKIVAQNRSHFVNSSYHPQFKFLDRWIQEHSNDLYSVLEDDTKILYGEWVYAKHSIEYTSLPDYFLAYDLYDTIEKRFYSQDRLESLLEKTSIKLVPTIKKGVFKNIDEIVSIATKTRSMFYDGLIEGVYVRKCGENWLEARGKIVRSNFICGNEHWTKNIMIVNKIMKE